MKVKQKYSSNNADRHTQHLTMTSVTSPVNASPGQVNTKNKFKSEK